MKNTSGSIFRVLWLTAAFFLVAADVKAQTTGTLDSSFGTAGLVSIPPPSGSGFFYDMAVQPDGKIVVVGSVGTSSGLAFANVVRLTASGAFDTAFDGDGFVLSSLIRSPRVVAVQTNGKILAGGFLDFGGTASNTGFVRLNGDGSPDTTLNGSGQVSTTIGTGFNPTSINVQPDGKIIVAGTTALTSSTQDFGILRYNADGTLDTTFGTGGRVATDISGTDAAFHSAVQPDGKLVVVGHSTDVLSNIRSATLVRYNADGSLDTAFGSGGKVIRASGTNTLALKVAVQTDGKIIIVGSGIPPLRFNPNGTPEATFQGADVFLYTGLAIQPNGKIVVSGGAGVGGGNYNFSVLRYNSDGLLDATFAGGRVVTAAAGSVAEDVLIQPDGKIVAGGTSYLDNSHIVLARYIGDAASRSRFDFDGDGRADVSTFRPSNGIWYLNQSTAGFAGLQFGASGDRIVPADYDGDGKTDVAVFRGGTWYVQRSQLGFTGAAFGDADDIPVPADYDGDGRADIAVFRPSNGSWYLQRSSLGFVGVTFGQNGDRPVAADYDGDGKSDIAVNRGGTWYIQRSQLGFVGVAFGDAIDKPVPADYDGDGKTDVAVFRPSNGTWYLNRSQQGFVGIAFGLGTDAPVPADYDGDGRTDVAVFRGGTWYLQRSTAGFTGIAFGAASDLPAPNAFVP